MAVVITTVTITGHITLSGTPSEGATVTAKPFLPAAVDTVNALQPVDSKEVLTDVDGLFSIALIVSSELNNAPYLFRFEPPTGETWRPYEVVKIVEGVGAVEFNDLETVEV